MEYYIERFMGKVLLDDHRISHLLLSMLIEVMDNDATDSPNTINGVLEINIYK